MIHPPTDVTARPGPLLLDGLNNGPGLQAHQRRYGPVPHLDSADLLALAHGGQVRGRGGAGFPFARKLDAVLSARRRRPSGRPVVIVNGAEGEPASAKDSALLQRVPHRVLDGAAVAARALSVRTVHVVTPGDRPWVGLAVRQAIAERHDGLRFHHHEAAPRFVAGQARAVIELISGREDLPVTAWAPEAFAGYHGRPTLLSNAESWAHLAMLAHHGLLRYAALGTPEEPGTTLLTVTTPPDPDGRVGSAIVVEVEHGRSVSDLLSDAALGAPALIGGFHGSWFAPEQLGQLTVSQLALRQHGASLGAGAVMTLAGGGCPVAQTARIVDYLADESAGQCGPCRFGLPSLATQVRELARHRDTTQRLGELTGLVTGRGACAHPDGTARLVTSLLTRLPEQVQAHLDRQCSCVAAELVRSA
ncbi:MAG: NADH-ubiquinone oxidoreductase-F iron-sulfur binding region domain-containing protein [Nostocoides sp.]